MSSQLSCSKLVTNTLGVADLTERTSFDSRRTADAHATISLKSSVKTRAESLIVESKGQVSNTRQQGQIGV